MTRTRRSLSTGRAWVPFALGLLVFGSGCAGSDPAPTVELRTATSPVQAPSATTAATHPPEPVAPSPTAMLVATATTPPTSTPAPTNTSTATSTPAPAPTATATQPPPTATIPTGAVVITAILNDPPVGRDADGETVTILNGGDAPVDMTGWTLTDIAEHTFVFPDFVLQPGATVTVHICDGEDTAGTLYWGRCSAIWNNDGDTAFLHDASGREIAAFSY